MLFTEDIVLISETCDKVNDRLEIWRQTLEAIGFRLSTTKTKNIEFKFSVASQEVDGELMIDLQDISKKETFRYL